jgi:hypothetical protein
MANNNMGLSGEEALAIAIKKSNSYTDQEISKVRTKFQVVASYSDLPDPGRTDTIYLVPQSGHPGVYDQYIYENNQYVDIGDTELDLAEYATDEELQQGLALKVDKVQGKGLSTEDYTTVEKTKLSGIEDGATNTVVDSALSTSSENPVQNKVVTTEINAINATLANKANTSGYYEDFVAGNAEQLLSSVNEQDSTPYLFRTTGGSIDVGNRETNTIVGGTIAWNQLVPAITSGEIYNNNGITCYSNGDGSFTLNGKATTTSNFVLVNEFMTPIDHIFYVCGYVKDSANTASALSFRGTKVDYGNGAIWKNTSAYSSMNVRLDYIINATYSNTIIKPQVFDLTQMFGPTIADYLNTLESGTPGAGIAKLKLWGLCTKSYYAYNAGELLSVKTSAHKMVGFNQWDEEWEIGSIDPANGSNTVTTNTIRSKNYIPVIEGLIYYINSPSNNNGIYQLYLYDENKNYIGLKDFNSITNKLYTIPSGCHYLRFRTYASYGTTYNNDICINISWDGEKDGNYESYVEYEYPLDSDLELRGIPKLDVDDRLYYDGDTYESDGTVTRKYEIVDLGTLTWTRTGTGLFNTESLKNEIRKPSTSLTVATWIISPIYTAMNSNDISGPNGANPSPDKVMAVNPQGAMYFNNVAYTDAATFKTAMSGVYLVYGLATETTESADPFTNPQICDDFGTEEYIDTRTIPIPVGHITEYTQNLKAKLEMAPDSPDSNGDYILRHQNGVNVYVPHTGGGSSLPETPQNDGEYYLKNTVSSGSPTLSWDGDILASLGLSIVNGELCVTYSENE